MLMEMMLVVMCGCSTIPIDPAETSHVMAVEMPAESVVLDISGVPTGEKVAFDEDVVQVEMKEEKKVGDVWEPTGRVWTLVVDDPVVGQLVGFETSPQVWEMDTPMRWSGRVLDGWREPVEVAPGEWENTGPFHLIDRVYEAPWSVWSWDYERKGTAVDRTDRPRKP